MWLENSPYPQDSRVRNQAEALSAAGYDLIVVAPNRRGQRRTERIGKVKVIRYPLPIEATTSGAYVLEYALALFLIFAITIGIRVRSRIAVIHAHNPPDVLVFAAIPFKWLGSRFLFDHHDLSPEMYEARFPERSNVWVRSALEKVERLTFRLADHVISTNESYRAIALGRGKKVDSQVTVVRNGPDLRRVAPTAADPVLRAKARLLIGYVGELGYQDGVDHLIRALSFLRDPLGETDFHCVIVGVGVSLPALRRLARDLGIEEYVTFTGRISDEDLMRTLSTVDICVDPDPSNPFNDRSSMIKLSEYLALGRPVVAYDLPEHRVTCGEAARYATPNDPHALARTIRDLGADPLTREAMSAFGRARAEQSLAWLHQVPSLLSAYDALLADARAR